MSGIASKLYNTGLGWFNDILDVRVFFSADLRDPNQTATASLPPDEEATEEDGVYTAEVPLFVAGAAVEGFIRISAPPGRNVSHNGVTAVLRSAAVSVDEDVNRELLLEELDLLPEGKLTGTVDLPFVFPGSLTAMLPDTVEGALFSIRNTVSVTVTRPWYTFEVKREAGFGIQRIFDIAPRCSYVVQVSSAGETTADVLAEVEDGDADGSGAPAAAAAGGPAISVEVPHTGASKTEPASKALALAGTAAASASASSAASKMHAQLALYGPQAALIADMDDGSAVQLVFDKGCYEITEKLAGSLVFEGVTAPIVLVRLAVLRVEYCNGDTNDEVIFDETILDARRWRERKNALRGLLPPVAPGKGGSSGAGAGRKGKGHGGRGPALSGGSAGDVDGIPRAKVVPTAGDGGDGDGDADASTVRLSSSVIGGSSDSSSVGQISALGASASVSSSARGSFDASGAALAGRAAAAASRGGRDDDGEDEHENGEDYDDEGDAEHDDAEGEDDEDEEEEMETAEDEHGGVPAHPVAAAAAARPRRGQGGKAARGRSAAAAAAAGGKGPKGGVRLKYAGDEEAPEGADEEDAEGEAGDADADGDAEAEEDEEDEAEEEGWYPSPEDLEGHSGVGDGSDVDPDVPIVGDVSLAVELEFGHIAGVAPTLMLKLPPPGKHIGDDADAAAAAGAGAGAAGRGRAGSASSSSSNKLVSAVDEGLTEDASVRFFVRLTVYTAFTPAAKRWATREVILFRERLYGSPAPEGSVPEPLYASAGALTAAAAAAAAGAGPASGLAGAGGRTSNPLARPGAGAGAAGGGAGAGIPPRKILPLALGAGGDLVGDGGATSPKLSPGVGLLSSIGSDGGLSARGMLGPAAGAAGAGRAVSPMHAVGAPALASASARAGSPVKAGIAAAPAGGGSPSSAAAAAAAALGVRGRVPSAPLDDGDLETLEGGLASSPTEDAGPLGPTVVVSGGGGASV